ncbi:MAG: hypothetical protein ACLTK0_09380 [Anaerovoracaceae bacterium]
MEGITAQDEKRHQRKLDSAGFRSRKSPKYDAVYYTMEEPRFHTRAERAEEMANMRTAVPDRTFSRYLKMKADVSVIMTVLNGKEVYRAGGK